MSNQDALDLLTPLVLIPLYWLMFRQTEREGAGLGEEIMFMLLAVLWVVQVVPYDFEKLA